MDLSMAQVTVVGTRHYEKGYCTAGELYNVLQRVQPEVIFEEVPPSQHGAFHIEKSRENLETRAINAYLANHEARLISVDHDPTPPQSFFDEFARMHQAIERISNDYCQLTDANTERTALYGLRYLNSDLHDSLQDKLDRCIIEALKNLDEEKFFDFHDRWRQIIELREETMINGIYAHLNECHFSKGIFLVGSAHRRSLNRKVRDRERLNPIKIVWNFTNYEGIL